MISEVSILMWKDFSLFNFVVGLFCLGMYYILMHFDAFCKYYERTHFIHFQRPNTIPSRIIRQAVQEIFRAAA